MSSLHIRSGGMPCIAKLISYGMHSRLQGPSNRFFTVSIQRILLLMIHNLA